MVSLNIPNNESDVTISVLYFIKFVDLKNYLLKLFWIGRIQGYCTQIVIQKTSCGLIFSNNLFLHVFGSVFASLTLLTYLFYYRKHF